MTDTAHIYTPLDDSLSERVRAARSVFRAYQRRQESAQQDTLGEEEEVAFADLVIARSINITKATISQEEWSEAEQEGLITNDEHIQIQQIMRAQEMEASRQQASEASDSQSDSARNHSSNSNQQ